MSRLIVEHPFKEGIRSLLHQHFSDDIVKNFVLEFEANIYTDDLKEIWNQKKQQQLILQVAYKNPNGFTEYICDVYSWMDRKQTEYKLLRYITDCFKAGKIGQDWEERDGKLQISKEVSSGKHETQTE